MHRRPALLVALAAIVIASAPARGQSPAPCPYCHRYHTAEPARPRPLGPSRGPNAGSNDNPNLPGTPGLSRGRRYYGGRYFGNFNDRFYGPQYGNF